MVQPFIYKGKLPAADDVLLPSIYSQVLMTGLGVLVIVYIVLLCWCYGTLNISKVSKIHRARRDLEAEYDRAFQRKEDLLFHLDWARQRGDRETAKQMEEQMPDLVKDLIALEKRLEGLDKKGPRRRD